MDKFISSANRSSSTSSEGSKILDDISQKLAKRKESEVPKDAKKRKDSTSNEESTRSRVVKIAYNF